MAVLVIDFELDPSLRLEQKLLRQRNGKLLLDVEGELRISVDHSCFFREPSLALLEFAVSLKEWRTKDSSAIHSFYYFTMEHDEREGPILALIKENESAWKLFSIWQEFNHESIISTDVLLKAVDRYLTAFEEILVTRFNIRYSDFINL
ncbi:DUF7878 domain-containing protein [Planococcus alpniumensis]|uniref:DUF7878 domain-containing protein n=1 Tax=Planococcus alpniumensis TaxID=2708345 RepID=UPI001B8C4FD7|nr:hypothetical protein [Planococcus sp. MSAK28401]